MGNRNDCHRHNDHLNLELTRRGSYGIRLAAALGALLLFASIASADPSVVRIEVDGCNAVAFSQIPGATDVFLGRRFNNANGDCLPGDPAVNENIQNLALYHMDWANRALSFQQIMLQVPAPIMNGSLTVSTAYDPSVEMWNGELWVAFECFIPELGGSASSCIAPFSISGGIDMSRGTVVIQGTADGEGRAYSGSVPKLLAYNGHLYLYWSVVEQGPPIGAAVQVTTRGVELGQEPGGQARLWATDPYGLTYAPISPIHPITVEVMGLVPGDPQSDSVADAFQMFSAGGYIYATSGQGGSGCLWPDTTLPGCYRLSISRTVDPLGYHAFNNDISSSPLIPDDTNQYARFIRTPDGSLALLGMFAANPGTLHSILPEGYAPGMYLKALPEDPFFVGLKPSVPLAAAPCDYAQLTSNGSDTAAVTYMYCQFLRRGSDPVGLDGTLWMLAYGNYSRAHLAEWFTLSLEFQDIWRGISNSAYVTLMYQMILSREPDPAGYLGWKNALDSGASRQDLVIGFVESPESQSTNSIYYH